MNVELIEKKLKTPTEFEFPFQPYDIQKDFMKNLYSVLEEKKFGIFESPTGTGKSLSLICGCLRWLKDHKIREREEILTTINNLKLEKSKIALSDDWLTSQSQEIEINKKILQLQLILDKIDQNEDKINKIKEKVKSKKKEKDKTKFNFGDKEEKVPENNDIEFLLEDNLDLDNDSDCEEDQNDSDLKYQDIKIFICSRTHSQISQLVNEVKKSPFKEKTRVITLSSRQNYCINPAIRKLSNNALINERCLDLQKSVSSKRDYSGKIVKKSKKEKCEFMKQGNVVDLSEFAIAEIQNLEDFIEKGRKFSACPFYSSRKAMENVELVFLPYNLILNKKSREASGINLKNNILIIDEAHNLLESLTEIHSCQISGLQLMHSHNQLTEYRDRYKLKFSALNLLHLNQLIFVVNKLINLIGGKSGDLKTSTTKKVESKKFTMQEFVFQADFDHLNLFTILKFCSKSKLAQKLNGFSLKYQNLVAIHYNKTKPTKTESGISAFLKQISAEPKLPLKEQKQSDNIPNPPSEEFSTESRNPILPVLEFIECLTNKCEDGRVFLIKGKTVGTTVLKFLLLNPSGSFEDVVQEVRSIIVAGGTMKPTSEFKIRLFKNAGVDLNRIVEFSCNHIVPKENILPVVLTKGPTGKVFQFSYQNRLDEEILNELGRLLQNIVKIIRGGIVCFFPSYDYENFVYNHLQKTNALQQISVKKEIFREPKNSTDVEKVLDQFAKFATGSCDNKTGALLFSVVGGKLSEGLNFSDDLGRCVIVVGLPYANIKGVELQEKMTYLNIHESESAGQIYYENLCMKAVNQCIGRAVRHKNDFANVILLDARFSKPKIAKSLPIWIQNSLIVCENFGPAFSAICKFFSAKK